LFLFRRLGAGLEAIAVVSGFQYVAAVDEAIEQRRDHFCVPKDRGTFAEAEVGGDDDAGAFVKLAQEDWKATTEKMQAIIADLRSMRLTKAADFMEE
jgi:hypothetical protein